MSRHQLNNIKRTPETWNAKVYEKQKQSLKTLWTDQTKINLYQNDRNENVCRREGTPYELKYIPSSGKHSGDSVIV